MIPGFLISIVTFPGVIVHEMAHQLFCRWYRVAVLDVCYFRFGNPAGYVVHEPPNTAGQSIMISVGPFLINSIVGGLIAFPAAIPTLIFKGGGPLHWALMWLGLSIAMHAFPSTQDARAMWSEVKKPGTHFGWKVLAFPIVGLIYLGAIGSVFWLDLIYGVGVALAIPYAIVHLLA